VSSSGAIGHRPCVVFTPYVGHWMSADGRYIVFVSSSDNLTSNSPNTIHVPAFYVRDRVAKTTVRVDVGNNGRPGVTRPVTVASAVMSRDGQWVAFVSSAPNLSPQAEQRHEEIYLRDLRTGALWLASLSSDGEAGNADSFYPSLSSDGSMLAFDSTASNLVAHDANAHQCPANIGGNCSNIYLHENVGAAD
jgi:Tol biopolymer transport system component